MSELPGETTMSTKNPPRLRDYTITLRPPPNGWCQKCKGLGPMTKKNGRFIFDCDVCLGTGEQPAQEKDSP